MHVSIPQHPVPGRGLRLALPGLLALLGAACAAHAPPAAPPPVPAPVVAPPTATRGEFVLEADKLDTWNAIGQILVNMPGVEYEGRSQMLDLYTVRYRGEAFLVLAKALLLSDTVRRTTTRVTATTRGGKPVDSDAAAELLAQLQRRLPDAIVAVRAQQAAGRTAQRAADSAGGKNPRKKTPSRARRSQP